MIARVVLTLVRKEMRDARRNKWFLVIAALFTGLSVSLSLMGFSGLGSVGVAGFGRTAASLLNLVVLLIPLMGLLLGGTSIVGEREQGRLEPLLSQPVTPQEVVLGKYVGSAAALLSAVFIGFGATALVISRTAGYEEAGSYAALVFFTALLGLAFLSVGFLISVFVRRQATAIGLVIVTWVGFLFLSDLGLMGTAVVLKLPVEALLWLVLINPAQSFKVAVMGTLHGNLESFGPAGLYALETCGPWLGGILVVILAAWILVPLLTAMISLKNKGVD